VICAKFRGWHSRVKLHWLSEKKKKTGPIGGRPVVASGVGLCKSVG
jgi:hypothetical protein